MFPHRPLTPGRLGRAPLRLLVAAVFAAGAAGFAPHARTTAADPALAEVSDVNLARAALTALDADPVLRDFNLVVSVVDRVAVVGGPVGSAEMKDRAAEVVRRVPGVRAVQNGCFLQAGGEPLLRSIAVATRPLPVLPSVVVPLGPPTATEATRPPALELVAVAPPAPEPLAGERSIVARRPVMPGASVLLPPVAPQAAKATVAAYPTGAPAVLTSRPAAADAVEAARRSQARFAGLRVEFREGGAAVVITGTAADPADAWDFADRLRAVPGVDRIVVGPVVR